jgi:hypothetical protein
MKNRSNAIVSFPVLKKKESICGRVELWPCDLADAKSYAMGERRIRLYADERSGRPIPAEWYDGVTILGGRISGSQGNGGCVIYYSLANDKMKKI